MAVTTLYALMAPKVTALLRMGIQIHNLVAAVHLVLG